MMMGTPLSTLPALTVNNRYLIFVLIQPREVWAPSESLLGSFLMRSNEDDSEDVADDHDELDEDKVRFGRRS
jgi:hypothetical protein